MKVPAGTRGEVVGVLHSQHLGILVDVVWDLFKDDRYAFSREDYDTFLTEDFDSSVNSRA